MRTRPWLWICAVLILLLLPGRLVADEAEEEKILDPDQLVPVDAEGNPLPSGTLPGDQLLPIHALRDITLAEAVRMGLKANLTLLAGSYTPPIAMEVYRAESAVFDPLVTADLEFAHDETPATASFFGVDVFENDTFAGSAGVSKKLKTGGTVSFLYRADRLDSNNIFNNLVPYWTQGAVVEGTQPLMRGAGDVVLTDIRLASNGVRIANENQRALVQDILLAIVRSYWDLVYAQSEVISRLKSEDVAAELLRDANARLAAKVGTPLDVAEAKAGLERRRGNRIQAERLRGAAQDLLRSLIMPFSAGPGAPGVTFFATDPVQGNLGAVPTADGIQQYIATAVANRPEMRAAEASIHNRDLEVYAAANAVKPQVDLIGRLGSLGLNQGFDTSLDKMVTGQAVSGAFGVRFSMFIGQRRFRAQLRLAEWARRQTALNAKEVENQVVAEVRAGVRDVITTRAVEEAGAEEVKAAKENLRGEERRRENGKSTPFRVLQKEDDLADARTRYLRSSTARRNAEASFWRAVGFLAETLGVGGTVVPCEEP